MTALLLLAPLAAIAFLIAGYVAYLCLDDDTKGQKTYPIHHKY